MRRKDIEIDIKVLNVHGQVNRALTPIEQNLNAACMRYFRNPLCIGCRTKHVRHVCHRDKTRFIAERRLIGIHVELTVFQYRNPLQDSTVTLSEEVPWDYVRMVLHDRQNNLVSRLDLPGNAIRNKVDPLGCTFGEDDFVHIRSVQETTGIFTRVFHRRGGFVGQRMQPPMHIGIGMAHLVRKTINDGLRLLSRRRAVEINKRLAIHISRQNRKFGSNGVDIELTGHSRSVSHAPASSIRISPSASGMSSSASPMNARVSSARACVSGMPRWRI